MTAAVAQRGKENQESVASKSGTSCAVYAIELASGCLGAKWRDV